MKSPHRWQSPSRSGSALTIILPLIAILTVIVVSAILIELYEGRQASNSLGSQETNDLAKMALDEMADKLSTIPLDKHWAAAPGRIRWWDGAAWQQIDLHSGDSTTDQVDMNAELSDGSNAIIPPNSDYPTAPQMSVDWKYVLKNGAVVSGPFSALTAAQKAIGVIGRYAYWADIENGRVNINTAGLGVNPVVPGTPPFFTYDPGGLSAVFSAPATYAFGSTFPALYSASVWARNPWMTDQVQTASGGLNFTNTNNTLSRAQFQSLTPQNLTAHPSSIDLSFLDDGITAQESLNTFRYAGSYFLRVDALNSCTADDGTSMYAGANPDMGVRYFNTPEDWQLIPGITHAVYEENKPYLTVLGRSPEINPWGLPKMPLSFVSSDGNALNDLSETHERNDKAALDPYLSYTVGFSTLEDSRRVQVPNMVKTSPGRNTFRDIASVLNYPSSNFSKIQNVVSALKNEFSLTFPGYTTTLSTKWNLNDPSPPGETEQIATEIVYFLDETLNGTAADTPIFLPQNGTTPGSGAAVTPAASAPVFNLGLMLPMVPETAPATGTRRVGTSGPFLLNELALQGKAVPWSAFPALPYSTYPVGLPMVFRMNSSTLSGGGWTMLNLLRSPSTPPSSNMYLFLKLYPELMIPPDFGGVQPLPVGLGWQFWITTAKCTWSSNDPLDPSGGKPTSLFYDVTVDPQGTTAPYPPGLGSLGASMLMSTFTPTYNSAANSYALPPNPGGIVLGPFAPGTVLSSLDIKLGVTVNCTISDAGNLTGEDVRIIDTIPGIFPDDPTNIFKHSATTSQYLLDYNFGGYAVGTASIPSSNPTVTVSYEVNDPRVSRHTSDWKLVSPSFVNKDGTTGNSLGYQNTIYDQGGTDNSDFATYPPSILQTIRGRLRTIASPINNGNGNNGNFALDAEYQDASKILGLPGVGYLAGIPTGVDSSIPWQTMKFYANGDNPPDWLLWNLFYVPFDRSEDNQTDGKININSGTLYPFTISPRLKPLEALLGNRVASAAIAASLATNIANRTVDYPLAGPGDMYIYSGQLCQVTGVADSGTEYQKEQLPRDLADIVTTQSSDYRVFIVAQSLKQTPSGGIAPISTRRIEATLSRVVDGGENGYPFSEADGANPGPKSIEAYLRGTYQSQKNASNQILPSNLIGIESANNATYGGSPWGLDCLPDTADDWLIPQKIQISSYRIIE